MQPDRRLRKNQYGLFLNADTGEIMKKGMWVLMGVAAVLFLSLPQNARGDNRRALAEELMNIRHMQETMKETVAVVKQMMKRGMASQIKNAGANVSASDAAAQEKMINTIMDLVTNEMGWNKIKDEYISMYADTYTKRNSGVRLLSINLRLARRQSTKNRNS